MANNTNNDLKAQIEEMQAKLAAAEAKAEAEAKAKAEAEAEVLELKAKAEADAKAKAEENAVVEEPEKMVTIRLPRVKGESDSVYVSINDRNWLIKRGVAVEVPECVANLFEEQDRAIEEAEERKERAKNATK